MEWVIAQAGEAATKLPEWAVGVIGIITAFMGSVATIIGMCVRNRRKNGSEARTQPAGGVCPEHFAFVKLMDEREENVVRGFSKTDTDMREIKDDVKGLRDDTREDIGGLRTDIGGLRKDITDGFGRLHERLDAIRDQPPNVQT